MQQRKILLLENVAAQAAGVRERLSQAGFPVAVSRYEADGFQRLSEWHPDLVLLSTAHPAGDLVEYCRRARALAPGAHIVITSSLNRERLFQQHPDLEGLVDGVLLRPYSFEEAVQLARAVPAPEAPEAPGAPGAPRTAASRLVVALDRDPECEAVLRRALEPRGVEVAIVPGEAAVAVCEQRRPCALVLQWPLPEALSPEALSQLRSGPGGSPAVLLLSGDAQETVAAAAPSLLQSVDMFFRKPVAWEYFFRVLARFCAPSAPGAAGPDRTAAPAVPSAEPGPAPPAVAAADGMLAEFQRQMEGKFLEVEELKRQVETARQAAAAPDPRLASLEAESARLRQQLQEAERKASLALAMERLKSSELEVKLDNLLRMKDDFEQRSQDELEARVQELEQVRAELETASAGATSAGERLAGLGGQLERALVEKEQLEERLHRLEATAAAAVPDAAAAERLDALAAEAQLLRGRAAESEVALADAVARAGQLEESLSREVALRAESAAGIARAEGRVAELLAERAELEGQAIGAVAARNSAEASLAEAEKRIVEYEQRLGESAERLAQRERDAAAAQEEIARLSERSARLEAACAALEERAGAAEAARVALAAEAETAVGEAVARSLGLERDLEQARASQPAAAEAAGLLERLAGLEASLAESGRAAAEAREAREFARTQFEQRERALAAEVETWRVRAEAAAREAETLAAHGGEREDRERREQAAALAQRAEERAERDRRIVELQAQLAAAEAAAAESAAARRRDVEALEERLRGAGEAAESARARLESAESGFAREREAAAARVRGLEGALADAQSGARALEERLRAQAADPGAAVQTELGRIQELLQEVVGRASADAAAHARSEAELLARLQSGQEDRRQLRERVERIAAEAAERERRSAALLQSVLERDAAAPPRLANLPALLPAEPHEEAPRSRPRTARRRLAWGAGAAALAGLAVAVVFGARGRSVAPVVRDPGPGVQAAAGAPTGVRAPQEVWERWTRSDESGGVLVQATLRSEPELRAEVDAERQTRGWSESEARAELVRRLADYRFEDTYYLTVYLKHLAPGYPAYLDDVAGRFRLRDGAGHETPAFIPPAREKDRRVFSFGSGAPADRIYEATVTLGFARGGLGSRPGYLQLVVSDVGTSARRVLTWELE